MVSHGKNNFRVKSKFKKNGFMDPTTNGDIPLQNTGLAFDYICDQCSATLNRHLLHDLISCMIITGK